MPRPPSAPRPTWGLPTRIAPPSTLRGPALALTAALAPLLVPTSGSAAAQTWNGPRALELVERARTLRHDVRVDADLHSYEAEAQGFVYFFLDRPDTDETALVKTDQVALEVYWQAPDRTRQRIVGLRDRKELPTNIKYHLDHLTVVQDEFSDRIRLGDGDEVADVTHPVAPGAEAVYDYRLADSLTISFPGGADDVRVYEVRVRPRDMDRPGFVGAIFLDRATAAIVRMSFTFTPASYVDPYLDYIRISLDNSLWMGRYWLPYRQEAELRRELPALDFLAGSIIRGRFEIRGYEFNRILPGALFAGRRVTAVPEAQRRAYPFEDSLYADLEDQGLATPPSLAQVREQAREMVRDRYLSGLRRLRLHLPSASSAFRYDRAEGIVAGLGSSFRPGGDLLVHAHAGYAFGRERPAATLRLTGGDLPATGPWAEAWWNRLEDVGPVPASSGVVNTLAALTAGEDWTDPYFSSGIAVGIRGTRPVRWLLGARPSIGLRWSHHRSAEDVISGPGDDFRPVRPATEGDRTDLEAGLAWGGGSAPEDGWGAEMRMSTPLPGVSDLSTFRTLVTVAWARSGGWRDVVLSSRLDAGGVAADAPPQLLFLLGGRETLLGHPFRAFVGDRFWLFRTEVERSVVEPWLSLRAFASVGQTDLRAAELPDGWSDLDPHGGVLAGVGGGVSVLWDVLRVDLGRGLDGGAWEAAFSVTHRFRRWL